MSLRLFYQQLLENVLNWEENQILECCPKHLKVVLTEDPPVLVLGSITAPDALKPPADVKKEDTTNQIYLQGKDLAIGETIGTDISAIEKPAG